MYRARLDYGLDTIDMSTATMRKLTIVALTAVPLGALIQEWFSSEPGIGLLLFGVFVLIGLATATALLATRAYKVVEGRPGPSGEYEKSLRLEGRARAYTILANLLPASLLYGFFAADLGLWLPRDKSDWHLVLILTVNLLMILPTAVLVWSGKLDNEPVEGE